MVINPADEDFSQQEHRKVPPTLILNPTDDMKVMQEEIFGPVLPVKTYTAVDDAIGYINDHDRPLGLYYFGSDAAEQSKVLDNTTSGGVTVNDVVFHVAQENLPFGGVGPSGMGSYHGADGFREFSHRKSVYTQLKKDIGPLQMLRPALRRGYPQVSGWAAEGVVGGLVLRQAQDEANLKCFGPKKSAAEPKDASS